MMMWTLPNLSPPKYPKPRGLPLPPQPPPPWGPGKACSPPTGQAQVNIIGWTVLEFNLLKIMIPLLTLLHIYMIFVSSIYLKCNYFYVKLLAL